MRRLKSRPLAVAVDVVQVVVAQQARAQLTQVVQVVQAARPGQRELLGALVLLAGPVPPDVVLVLVLLILRRRGRHNQRAERVECIAPTMAELPGVRLPPPIRVRCISRLCRLTQAARIECTWAALDCISRLTAVATLPPMPRRLRTMMYTRSG
jgi:hypothetical protein